MSKEKRNNLAIYTLAGSILLSSVLVSMNQAHGEIDTRQLEMKIRQLERGIDSVKNCVNSNFSSLKSSSKTKSFQTCKGYWYHAMTGEEKRYRVTAEYRSVHQLIIEATSPEEAEYFANDIDLDKWKFIDGEYEIVDVAKDYFLKKVKDE